MSLLSSSSSCRQELPRIVTLSEIEAITSRPEFAAQLVEGIRRGFLQQQDFYMAPIQTLGAPPASPAFCSTDNYYSAQACVKTGYFVSGTLFVIKVASGGHPWPTNSGNLQLYSQATGRLESLLLDEGLLTELRTAAVGALAFSLWSPRNTTCIGVLGCGVQARYQLQLLLQANITSCRNVRVYGRNPSKVQAYVKDMTQMGWTVSVASTANDLLETCDVIVTTTSSRTPLLTDTSSLQRVRLLICIGSDAPGKSEVANDILKAANVRVADSIAQSRERGEYQSLATSASILSLTEALQDPTTHRQKEEKEDDRLVVFDSSGLALQDCVIAQMVYEALLNQKDNP